jgi:hypothetical protein
LQGPVLAIGRLYRPAGNFYGYRRELARGGKREYRPGGELGGPNGRGREFYGLAGWLGGFSG